MDPERSRQERSSEVESLVAEVRSGNATAKERLFSLVYDELRTIARRHFRGRAAGHTLEPTALVNEVFLRMVERGGSAWRDRSHFMAVCAVAMRRILADHARRKAAAKRGGGLERVTLSGIAVTPARDALIDAIELEAALTELSSLDERQARLAELRLFGGLTVEEVARELGLSASAVEKGWRMARAFLGVRLGGRPDGGGPVARGAT